ncbi:hypothetical protein SADUNF_Sadunf06G0138200 [Salix dunnii]|uniref:Uncharacterized protein n=1 Tax=Salix dunnii TaxID=1413687 RepID=A0A835K759_9ROSI|nr:hypothetical protein SADUNF_Sadunf06G0138200 [Salix dunnii]
MSEYFALNEERLLNMIKKTGPPFQIQAKLNLIVERVMNYLPVCPKSSHKNDYNANTGCIVLVERKNLGHLNLPMTAETSKEIMMKDFRLSCQNK